MSASTATEVRVRCATLADCDTLALLRSRLQAALEAENAALWRMTEARQNALRTFYAQSVSDPSVLVLLAEVGSPGAPIIAGTATGRIEAGRDVAKFGSIEDVWVEPEQRRRGVFRALLTELTRFFEAHDVPELTVGFAHGGAASELWQHFGFQPAVVLSNGSLAAVKARLARS
jgi:ribosomal protein S18 acetylase RimI-like enzyme